jgi:transcriptional regulator with XRE-family HTH domain
MTGAELIHARNQLRLTQSELAELLCVTSRTVQRYERASMVPQVIQWALLELAIQAWFDDVTGEQVRKIDDLVHEELVSGDWVTVEGRGHKKK